MVGKPRSSASWELIVDIQTVPAQASPTLCPGTNLGHFFFKEVYFCCVIIHLPCPVNQAWRMTT